MDYFDKRSNEIKDLHEVFNMEMPNIIRELVEIPELARLGGISANCGVDYCRISPYKFFYSTLDHDVSLGLIMTKFGQDKKSIAAGLLHDINTSAFSHTYSFMKEDYRLEKAINKANNFDTMIASENLFEFFIKNQISVMDVYDSYKYPLLSNLTPKLSADRLAYIMENALNLSLKNIDKIANMYNDLTVENNENFNDEFAFQTVSLAEEFCLLSIEVAKVFNSYEQKLTMQFLADILKLMIKRGIINEEDLFKYQDKVIIDMGLSSKYNDLVKDWYKFFNIEKVFTSFNKPQDKYCTQIISKRRYVDPLVRTNRGLTRISKISRKCKNAIYEHLVNNTDLYAYLEE